MEAVRQFQPEGILGGWGGPAERAANRPMLPHPELLCLSERRKRRAERRGTGEARPDARSTAATGDLERQWERIAQAAMSDGARRGSALVWLLGTKGRPGQ